MSTFALDVMNSVAIARLPR